MVDEKPSDVKAFLSEMTKPDDRADISNFEIVGRILIYLGILGGLGYAALYFVRQSKSGGIKMRLKGNKGGLVLKETHTLGNKQFLVVVEYEGQKFLLGVGPGMINKLCDLGAKTEPQ